MEKIVLKMDIKWITEQKIAHRGLHNHQLPENSLGAFANAIKHGFAIELDVHKIKDGTIVVFHDDDLSRMCHSIKFTEDLTKEELQDYTLLTSKYYIPTLDEVLNMVNGQVPILIEIKNSKLFHRFAPQVYEVVRNYQGAIAIKSFNPLEVIWFRKHAPHIPRGMLACYLENANMPRIYRYLIRSLSLYKSTKPHFISYCMSDLPNKYVSKYKIPLLTWTITSKELEAQALAIADNIIFEGYTPEQSHIGV